MSEQQEKKLVAMTVKQVSEVFDPITKQKMDKGSIVSIMKSFDEAVLAVQTRSSSSYIGFLISSEDKKVEWYTISADEEEPEVVNIWYEGGSIFSSSGEEDSYSLEDLPDEARFLRYMDSATVPNMSGSTADHVLYKLFPELPDPEMLWGHERKDFFATALEIARDSGRATIINPSTEGETWC